MLLIDRDIKIRKELFGLELFDLLSDSEENEEGGKKGIKKRISQSLAGVTQQEKDIQSTIDQFKKDISAISKTSTNQSSFLATISPLTRCGGPSWSIHEY